MHTRLTQQPYAKCCPMLLSSPLPGLEDLLAPIDDEPADSTAAAAAAAAAASDSPAGDAPPPQQQRAVLSPRQQLDAAASAAAAAVAAAAQQSGHLQYTQQAAAQRDAQRDAQQRESRELSAGSLTEQQAVAGVLDLKELRRQAVAEALLDPLRHSQDSPLGLRLSQEDGNISGGSSSSRAAHDGMYAGGKHTSCLLSSATCCSLWFRLEF
jgi:hypothetical protein